MNTTILISVNRKPSEQISSGLLSFNDKTFECSLGKKGISALKIEGDGVTPRGKFQLLYGFYRKDRIKLPRTQFPFFEISKDGGWCDDPENPNYNRPVKLPFKSSHEKMFRQDGLYDICIVLDYNLYPIARNRGSAIFFHLQNQEKGPTEGCVAIDRGHMLKLIPHLKSKSVMKISL